MKFVKNAVDKSGGTPNALQRELAKEGVYVSVEALRKAAASGKESLRLDILVGIVKSCFGGNWEKAGKALEAEFLPRSK